MKIIGGCMNMEDDLYKEYRTNPLFRFLTQTFNVKQRIRWLIKRFVLFGLLYTFLTLMIYFQNDLYILLLLVPMLVVLFGYLFSIFNTSAFLKSCIIPHLRVTPFNDQKIIDTIFMIHKMNLTELAVSIYLYLPFGSFLYYLEYFEGGNIQSFLFILILSYFYLLIIYCSYKIGNILGLETAMLGVSEGRNLLFVLEDLIFLFILLFNMVMLIMCPFILPIVYYGITEYISSYKLERLRETADKLFLEENKIEYFPFLFRNARFEKLKEL